MSVCMYVYMDGWIDGYGWMVMDGWPWMNVCMYVCMYVCLYYASTKRNTVCVINVKMGAQ